MQAAARNATIEVLRTDPDVDFPPDQLEALAELVRASTVGLALWWREHPERSRASVVDLAADFLLRGLRSLRARSEQPHRSHPRVGR